jgi:HAD superfamily hydrolase (TIGR01509 family)
MRKLIIFDLDGVLVDAKTIHYEALNQALRDVDNKFTINLNEHLSTYDGLSTRVKLDKLSKEKLLPYDKHDIVWKNKQKITNKKINKIKPDNGLIEILSKIKEHNIKIACCSNSIRNTIYAVLSKLDIAHFFDLVLSNEDVIKSKPYPEIYWKAMTCYGFLPEETLIVEDSPRGLSAAHASGAGVLRVDNRDDLSYDKIMNKLTTGKKDKIKWTDEKLNVLIPMAGAGSRFEQAGYSFPKPLIDVNGKPMIQVVVDNLNFKSNHIFIVQKQHREKYNLDSLLPLIAKKCSIIDVDGITEGAACTTLLAEKLIDNDNPLIIANSDQFLEWEVSDFMYEMKEHNVDAGIVTFTATHPKWSFAKVDEYGIVTEVAEKNPISDIATVGVYYWKKGSDYVKYAKSMISRNKRFNNEFYVCPVFNEAIIDNKKIKIYHINKMQGLGTPEDLNIFLKNENNIA